MKKNICLILVAVVCLAFEAFADLSVSPLSKPLVIDGKLTEMSWQKAARASGFSILKSLNPKNKSPRVNTSFSILADAENLYVGIRCDEPNMSALNTKTREDSTNPWADDVVEVFMCPTGRANQYYQFVVSTGGAKWQMFYGEKGFIKPDPYAPLYDAKVFKGSNFWSIEIKIPLSAFYMTKAKFWKTNWLFNVGRFHRQAPKIPELSTWSPLSNKFHESEAFRKVSGFPKKNPATDIYFKSLVADVKKADKNSNYMSNLTVNAQISPQAAGKYTLQLSSPYLAKSAKKSVKLKAGDNKIEFSGLNFTRLGRYPVQLLLKNQSGKLVSGRTYPTLFNYNQLRLRFDTPGYNRCFYPGQPANRLKGVVKVNLKTDYLKLSVNGKSFRLPVKNGQAKFDVDISKEAGNQIKVRVEVGKVFAETVIRKLKPTGKTMVWVKNNRLIVNGKPTFSLGYYVAISKDKSGYCIGRWTAEKYPDGPDHPANCPAWVNMQTRCLVPGSEQKEGTKDVKPCAEMFEKVKAKIEENRNKDFWFYYLSDEPECRGVSPVYLKYVYDYIKKLDPYHPVMLVSRSPGRYLDCCDIVSPHPYIAPLVDEAGKRMLSLPVSQVRSTYQKINAFGKKDKVLVLMPQVFSYSFNNIYGEFPTFDETNASIWSSVCHGGQGIAPYIYSEYTARPDLKAACDYTFSSLHYLEKFITSTDNPLVKSSNSKVDARLFAIDGKVMLALVNITPKTRKTTISAQALTKFKTLEKFREPGQIKLNDGSFKLKMAPYQVFILTSKKENTTLPTLPKIRKQIAREEKARRSRGNILFGKGKGIELNHSRAKWNTTMYMQDILFDGMIDKLAWRARDGVYKPTWFEFSFPKFIPKFSKTRIYGNRLKGLTFKIWKYGEWQQPKVKIKEDKHCTELDFGKTLSTVKIRLDFQKVKRGQELELYEFELVK
jgi:cellulose/xylan binding protein with CBM9 domain